MRKVVQFVVVIPVGPLGPKLKLHHVLDTVDSVFTHAGPSTQVIIMDDSGEDNLGAQIQDAFPNITLLRTGKNQGYSGGLYLSLSQAFLYAHQHFDFEVIMKLDTDALMVGDRPEEDAIQFFAEHPDVGEIGTYLIGANGEVSEFSWPREQLVKETSLIGWVQDRKRCKVLRELVTRAEANGYEQGEHILGGACFFSQTCIDRLAEANLLAHPEVGRSILQDDHLFGLLVKSVGMHLGDFGTPEHPLAVRWQGMPFSPQDALAKGKKIVHSTRFWEDMGEDTIRGFFREKRKEKIVS
jgi:hypothetical protein